MHAEALPVVEATNQRGELIFARAIRFTFEGASSRAIKVLYTVFQSIECRRTGITRSVPLSALKCVFADDLVRGQVRDLQGKFLACLHHLRFICFYGVRLFVLHSCVSEDKIRRTGVHIDEASHGPVGQRRYCLGFILACSKVEAVHVCAFQRADKLVSRAWRRRALARAKQAQGK